MISASTRRASTRRASTRRAGRGLSKAQLEAIEQRKQWAKFGACSTIPPGTIEPGITWRSSDEVFIEWTTDTGDEDETNDNDEKDKKVDFRALAARQVRAQLRSERFHQRLQQRKTNGAAASDTNGLSARLTRPGSSSEGKYVPPFRRHGANFSVPLDTAEAKVETKAEVKISNLSLDATHADVEELCGVFGHVKRIVFSRDKLRPGYHRGIVYVTFDRQVHADKCIAMLDGHGYDHLILSVSKP